MTATTIILFLLSTLIFFILHHDNLPNTTVNHRRSLLTSHTTTTTCSHILQIPKINRCTFSKLNCSTHSNGIFNYFSFHFCHFNQDPNFSIPFLTIIIILIFHILIKTAQNHFSVIVTKLSSHLNLSPSMGAVTLLDLGNGTPDVFESVATVGGGNARTGFGAILSAGAFVSALVVGFVAIYAAPFVMAPDTFVRDVLFYFKAVLFMFYVYLSGEIYMWQAVGFVVFYLFFVVFVFWMDFGFGNAGKLKRRGSEVVGSGEDHKISIFSENGKQFGDFTRKKTGFGIRHMFDKMSKTWEIPVSMMLNLTIPQSSSSEWDILYRSANIALCPLALAYACKSIIPLNHPIVFLLPNIHFPLWLIIIFGSSSLALVHFVLEKTPPKAEQMPVVLTAFVMRVFWISSMAGELLNCLAALGSLLEVPPSLLGLTVLAWGIQWVILLLMCRWLKRVNLLGHGWKFCWTHFNMLFGLGTTLVIQTMNVYPKSYVLQFHVSIVVAFVYLIMSLMGSLLVVTWCRFQVPRFWGFFLVGLYVLFIVLGLFIAKLQF